ncbi:hypothetical protein [Candidatus Mycoplasma mahonii]|uniref:hypothetical protein n=1 Tax=Candidatus Mycoplasma mahonii TaxID=3004105 RepID=UPI0026F2ABD3|nr:hypothetical protein [Candidatus Mycoplasma mahonii]WKX02502.1 hypothetical protein O3I44_00255 [Candidatus Mycoplasma mahonii]
MDSYTPLYKGTHIPPQNGAGVSHKSASPQKKWVLFEFNPQSDYVAGTAKVVQVITLPVSEDTLKLRKQL